MRTVPLGTLVTPPTTIVTSINGFSLNSNFYRNSMKPGKIPFTSKLSRLSFSEPFLSHLPNSGMLCRASQVVELYPTACPEIVVREARLEDSWDVAETHCSTFYPKYRFPFGLLLRINRMVGLVSGFLVPNACRRTCLVADICCSVDDTLFFASEDCKVGDGFGLNKGYVAGILTVDTVANFLPRKGPSRQRRTGIAYLSNVAVREGFRRKGIAKRLVAKAEAQATSWGCRAIALHCDLNDPAATKLYIGQGFKNIKVPEGANWPRPRTSPDVQFKFMMKLLNTPTTV